MGKTVKITCDGCGHDLTVTSNSVDYRLVLMNESKPGYGDGVYTDVMIYPKVDRTYYFCDLGCLDYWRSREHHKASAWKDAHDLWVEHKGTKDETGRVRSWPSMPEEMRKSLEADFEAEALAAFPMGHMRPEKK